MIITLIGAGNVGYHLGKRLFKKGFKIKQVFSRQLQKAKHLALITDAFYVDDLQHIQPGSDLYLIAVSDDAIALVAETLSLQLGHSAPAIVAHTSGAVPGEILSPYFKNYGVFYPLQSFSRQRKVRFSAVPLCVDANSEKSLHQLKGIAERIAERVSVISDQDRAVLHVAAVFVNNFSNHLFHIADTITNSENIDFSLLWPLIRETASKIENQTPFSMQTGPARRGDEKTIKKHLDYLQKYPEYAQLYQLITKIIQDAYRR